MQLTFESLLGLFTGELPIDRVDEANFWKLIAKFDWSKDNNRAIMQPAIDALGKLNRETLQEFDEILAAKLYTLDTRQFAKSTGFGDKHYSVDMFLYNRCYVVANGKSIYGHVLKTPSVMDKNMDFESLLYLTYYAALQQGIDDYSHHTQVSYETFSNEKGWEAVHFPEGLPPGHLPKYQRK